MWVHKAIEYFQSVALRQAREGKREDALYTTALVDTVARSQKFEFQSLPFVPVLDKNGNKSDTFVITIARLRIPSGSRISNTMGRKVGGFV